MEEKTSMTGQIVSLQERLSVTLTPGSRIDCKFIFIV
jgi:hypothetical protein